MLLMELKLSFGNGATDFIGAMTTNESGMACWVGTEIINVDAPTDVYCSSVDCSRVYLIICRMRSIWRILLHCLLPKYG